MMDKQREAFEAWAKKPPREFYLARHPDAAAWPGNYKDYHVECAWQAYQAGMQAQWLPIESAPRDGSEITVGWYGSSVSMTVWWDNGWETGDSRQHYEIKPDVWMPLPPEPKR